MRTVPAYGFYSGCFKSIIIPTFRMSNMFERHVGESNIGLWSQIPFQVHWRLV